jgi:hypothetical protein
LSGLLFYMLRRTFLKNVSFLLVHNTYQKVIVVVSNYDTFKFKDPTTGVTVEVTPHFFSGDEQEAIKKAISKLKEGSYLYIFKKLNCQKIAVYVGHKVTLLLPVDGNALVEEKWLVFDKEN